MRSVRASACLCPALAVLLGLTWSRPQPVTAAPPTDKIGKKIDSLAFKDEKGNVVALKEMTGKKAFVVVFLSFDCPVSNSYSQPLSDLAKAYAAKGVAFFGVCPCDEGPATIARQASDYRLAFPVYKDFDLAAADALKAAITPEAFVLDHNLVVRYRGRIDDAYHARLKKNPEVTRHDLRQALDEVLAGQPVSRPATEAIGCPVARERTGKSADGKVTFHRDVLPILQNHCQSCHRPGAVGPFSLMTYRQASNWATDIKDFTQTRRMPPWKPAEGLAFHNERRLSERDIATLAAWVDADAPEGNPKDAPPPVKFTEGWQLGEPDLVLTPSEDTIVGASGRDHFRCFVLPTNLPEDRYVAAIEVKPGNPRIVHHALLFVDATCQGRRLEKQEKDRVQKDDEIDRGPGYSVAMGVGFIPQGGLGGWAPGQLARRLPEGTGYYLPRGADVVMQLHYHRNGRVERDRTAIGLYFAKKPVSKRFHGGVIPGRLLLGIPPDVANFKVTGSLPSPGMHFPNDFTLHSIMPHMHMLGKEIKVVMRPPEGDPVTLIHIKDWDYNWQETYFLKEPLLVKAGTRFEVEAIYDNSSKNPNNPFNPPRRVFFGEQTTNEMCFVFLGVTSDRPGRIRPASGDRPAAARDAARTEPPAAKP